MAGTLLVTACQPTGKTGDVIGKQPVKVENGIMTTEVLMAFGRVSGPVVSPDKSKILYGVSYENLEQNKSNRELFVMDIDGQNKKQITCTPESEGNAVWIDGGKQIAYLSGKSGDSQLWIMNADGSNARQISYHEKGVHGFLFSPDEKHILFIGNVKYSEKASDLYPDLDKATGRVIDDLMYKHWDEWVEEIPHPYIASFDGKQLTDITDIMEGEPYESPMKPFGGIESFAWTPDSKAVAYTSRKKTGMEYSLSTNSDIYLYDLSTQETKNLTEGMMGYDTTPAFSPDGKYLAWGSMEREGYESDKNRLFIMNMETGEKQDLTSDFDYSTDEFFRNSHCFDTRSVIFQLSTWFGNCFFYFTEYVHTSFFCLIQSTFQNFVRQTVYLDIHLGSRNTIFCSRYFEVHITQVVFVTQNIRQYSIFFFARILNQSHSDT